MPCYEETFQERVEFIREEFKNDSLEIERQIHELQAVLNQRLEIYNELQKIKILLKLQDNSGDSL